LTETPITPTSGYEFQKYISLTSLTDYGPVRALLEEKNSKDGKRNHVLLIERDGKLVALYPSDL
jgi:hypothetical protein